MVRDLKVALSTEELLAKASEMAEVQRKKELLEDEKKSTAKALTQRIDEYETKQSALATVIRDKSEMRSIVCRIEKDFINKQNLVIRSDTGEVIERHPMTAADLQTKLPIEKKEAEGEKADDGSIPTPAGFDDADVGQIWKSGKLGCEVKIVAKADSSIVIELAEGGTTRVFADTWAMFDMSFVRFCDREEPREDVAGEPIGLLGAANPAPAPGQIWAIHGYEVLIESINDEADNILVEYLHDGSKSYFKTEEWKAGEARFLRTEEKKDSEPRFLRTEEKKDSEPASEDKPKRKRGKKAA